MNYTVTWKPEAERRLASIWTRASDRKAVTEAADLIDRTLGRRPEIVGESREEEFRVLLRSPLGVMYTVSPPDRTVLVVAVWVFEPRHGTT